MTLQPATAAPVMPSSITQYVADYHALSELMRRRRAHRLRPEGVPPPKRSSRKENRNPTGSSWTRGVREVRRVRHDRRALRVIGLGVGQRPVLALQNVHVVNGKPGLYAEPLCRSCRAAATTCGPRTSPTPARSSAAAARAASTSSGSSSRWTRRSGRVDPERDVPVDAAGHALRPRRVPCLPPGRSRRPQGHRVRGGAAGRRGAASPAGNGTRTVQRARPALRSLQVPAGIRRAAAAARRDGRHPRRPQTSRAADRRAAVAADQRPVRRTRRPRRRAGRERLQRHRRASSATAARSSGEASSPPPRPSSSSRTSPAAGTSASSARSSAGDRPPSSSGNAPSRHPLPKTPPPGRRCRASRTRRPTRGGSTGRTTSTRTPTKSCPCPDES
jgi:hypothetical protein